MFHVRYKKQCNKLVMISEPLPSGNQLYILVYTVLWSVTFHFSNFRSWLWSSFVAWVPVNFCSEVCIFYFVIQYTVNCLFFNMAKVQVTEIALFIFSCTMNAFLEIKHITLTNFSLKVDWYLRNQNWNCSGVL
jgi:hypothetical protein